MTSLGYAGPYAHMDQQNLMLYVYGAILCDHTSLQNDDKQDTMWWYNWLPLLRHLIDNKNVYLSASSDIVQEHSFPLDMTGSVCLLEDSSAG